MRRVRLRRERHQNLMTELKRQDKKKLASTKQNRNYVRTIEGGIQINSSTMLGARNVSTQQGKTGHFFPADSLFQQSTVRQLEDTAANSSHQKVKNSHEVSLIYQVPNQMPISASQTKRSRSSMQQIQSAETLPRIVAHKQLQSRLPKSTELMQNAMLNKRRSDKSGSVVMLSSVMQENMRTAEVNRNTNLINGPKQMRSSAGQIQIEEKDYSPMRISRSNMFKKKQVTAVVSSGLMSNSNQGDENVWDSQLAATRSLFADKSTDARVSSQSLVKESSEYVHQMETKPVYSSTAEKIKLVVQDEADEYTETGRESYFAQDGMMRNASASQVVQTVTSMSEKQVYQSNYH